MARAGMVIDLARCIGCFACVIACKLEHSTPPGILWARVLEREEGKFPTARRFFLPVLCNHCNDAPCTRVCPSGATYRGENGLVLIDNDKCIGCRACATACPYGARFFHKEQRSYFPGHLTPYEKEGYRQHQTGTVQKCDFCRERQKQGLEPACVQTCPTSARVFGDLEDPQGSLQKLIWRRRGFQLRSEMGTDPSVYYLR